MNKDTTDYYITELEAIADVFDILSESTYRDGCSNPDGREQVVKSLQSANLSKAAKHIRQARRSLEDINNERYLR